jgi:hypothetical protein
MEEIGAGALAVSWIGGKNLFVIIFIICGAPLLINRLVIMYSIIEGGYYDPLQILLFRRARQRRNSITNEQQIWRS